jgi:meiotic recombination protein DMC1
MQRQRGQTKQQQALEEEQTVAPGLGDQTFRLVEELQSMGINVWKNSDNLYIFDLLHTKQVSDIKKLQEAGLTTVGSVLQTCSRDLNAIKGLSDAKIEKIKEAAKKLDCRGSAFKTGLEMKDKRKQVIHVTTGSTALDAILGGGVETSSITELFGEFRTGKTQLAHTLCVTRYASSSTFPFAVDYALFPILSSQLAFNAKGGQGKVIYLDTEGNFRPERIESIADRFGLGV